MRPRRVNAWSGSWRPRPSVEKSGVHDSGPTFTTPARMATIVVTRMLMIRAALILRAPEDDRQQQAEQGHELLRLVDRAQGDRWQAP